MVTDMLPGPPAIRFAEKPDHQGHLPFHAMVWLCRRCSCRARLLALFTRVRHVA